MHHATRLLIIKRYLLTPYSHFFGTLDLPILTQLALSEFAVVLPKTCYVLRCEKAVEYFLSLGQRLFCAAQITYL